MNLKNSIYKVLENDSPYRDIVIFLICLMPYFWSIGQPFFWDTIQFAGKQGLFFYENGFDFLPNEIDSGHLPFLGVYLSICWKLFGFGLVTSHMAMFPFLLIYGLATRKLSKDIAPDNPVVIWILLMIEPCYLAQSTLVSPDVVLMAGFASSTMALLGKNYRWMVVGSILLALSGNRGAAMMVVFGLVSLAESGDLKTKIKNASALIPGLLLFISYQILHLRHTAWVGFHEQMDWAPSFEKVGALGYLRNLGLLFWRCLDTGRWVLFPLILWALILRKPWKVLTKDKVFILLIFTTIMLMVLTIPYKYLIGHRYYMPIYFLLICWFSSMLIHFEKIKRSYIILTSIVSFITGHVWVYPRGIAMGWDSTLAYLPYQSLRQEAIAYLKSQNISTENVGSAFPNISGFEATDLDLSGAGKFKPFAIGEDAYILYSNVMNDLSDEVSNILNMYEIEQQWVSGSVEMILFKKK